MSEPAPSATASVITPVFNRLIYLGTTIDSVLNQTYTDWELIVVDDGSKEDVVGFIGRYPDARVRFLRQTNQGNAAARSAGLREATGKYIVCLDSDDVWQDTMLERCVSFLAAHPDMDVVYTQVQAIDCSGRPLKRPVGPPPHNGDLLEALLMGHPILPSSAVMRRSCFERWGAYTPGLDDWELWLRWAAQGCRFACIEQPLLCYRIHDQSLNLDWERRRAAHFTMLDTFYAADDLPKAAWHLRAQAYANQHFRFAVLAWQVGRTEEGMDDFRRAVVGHPDYLNDVGFYTDIACAHQGRIDAGSASGLDLEIAESTLCRALDALFATPELPVLLQARRCPAYGWAYLALARLAYSVSHDMEYARRYMVRSLVAWPAVLWRTDWAVWLVRVLLGHKKVQAIKAQIPGRIADA